jgi:hypothetical protein
MQSNSNHRSRQAQQREQKKQEQYRHFYFLVERVIAAYIRVSELPLLTAITYDPDLPQQHTLSRTSHDFLIDVERATEAALKGFPALQTAWFDLAEDGKVSAALQRSIVTKCGRVYQDRGLCPNKYLHSFKRGRAA